MNRGLVSVVTPSYNCANYIVDTIKSVQKQTYRDWEMLITDDCSDDNSVELIKEIAASDSRIKLFILEKNSGAGVARNNSIKHANGKYIAFLDSDDLWLPNKLECQIAFMEEKKCSLSYTSYLTMDEIGKTTGVVLAPNIHTFAQNKRDSKIGFSTAMYNQELLGKIYMPTIRKRQDWGLLMTVLKKCNVSYGIKQPLVFYRKGHASLSNNKLSLISYNVAAYKTVLGWSSVRAYLFFAIVYMPCHILKVLFNRIVNNY